MMDLMTDVETIEDDDTPVVAVRLNLAQIEALLSALDLVMTEPRSMTAEDDVYAELYDLLEALQVEHDPSVTELKDEEEADEQKYGRHDGSEDTDA